MPILSFLRRQLKKKKPSFFVTNNKTLKMMDLKLSKSKIIGIDTEFEWRTTYFPKLSIVQLSTRNNLFLIDCLIIVII